MEHEESQNILRDVVNEEVETEEFARVLKAHETASHPRETEGQLPQDEDFALAKIMQEQERAFFHARNLYGYVENELGNPEFGHLSEPEDSDGSDDQGEEPEGVSGSGEDATAEAEPLDDEELARRLHIQEQIEHQRRLMELAGIVQDGEAYTDDEEEGYLTDDSVDPDDMTYEELRALGDAVGVVSRGASVDVIKALPLARFVGQGKVEGTPGATAMAAEVAQASGQEEQCVVCRMEFESGEDIKMLPCKHVFHPECIDQWLTINKACPICASEVTATGSTAATADPYLKSTKDI